MVKIERQSIGKYVKKPRYLDNPTQVAIIDLAERTNKWNDKEWNLTFQEEGNEDVLIIKLSKTNVNEVLDIHPVEDTDDLKGKLLNFVSTFEGKTVVKEQDGTEKEVEAYKLHIS